MLRASIPATIEIRLNITDAPVKVLADYTEMHQVLMNLCTNAAHAMGDSGGVLEILIGTVEIDEKVASVNPDFNPGLYQRLTVSDTGHGMDKEIQARIFDPFFTTKAQGEGTGMGMSVVHGIVKNHGGTITVYSEPGTGLHFSCLHSSHGVRFGRKPPGFSKSRSAHSVWSISYLWMMKRPLWILPRKFSIPWATRLPAAPPVWKPWSRLRRILIDSI